MVPFVLCAKSSSSPFTWWPPAQSCSVPVAYAPSPRESLLLKHQLLISNRARKRAPNLATLDRFVLGLTALFVSPRRIAKLRVLVKPATLFKFHRALVDRNIGCLLSCSRHRCKPGPRSVRGTHRGHRGDEAAESAFLVHADRPAHRSCLRRRDRQRYRSPRACEILSARLLRTQRPLLVDVHRARER